MKVLKWWFNRLGTPLAIITGKKVGKKVAGIVAVERIFPCFIFFSKSCTSWDINYIDLTCMYPQELLVWTTLTKRQSGFVRQRKEALSSAEVI